MWNIFVFKANFDILMFQKPDSDEKKIKMYGLNIMLIIMLIGAHENQINRHNRRHHSSLS